MITILFSTCLVTVYNYTFGSSRPSAKDEAQTRIVEKLAAVPALETVAPVVAWWSLLTDPEKAAINAARADARVQSFVDRAQTGKADTADLDYLVARGLLMQAAPTPSRPHDCIRATQARIRPQAVVNGSQQAQPRFVVTRNGDSICLDFPRSF